MNPAVEIARERVNTPNVYIPSEPSNLSTYNIGVYIPGLWVKAHPSSGSDDKIKKVGDTMLGDLDMGGNKITSLSDNPTNDTDVVNKKYVDSRKPLVSVWATAKGDLHQDQYEFEFGEKSRISSKGRVGWICPTNGRIIRANIKGRKGNMDVENLALNTVRLVTIKDDGGEVSSLAGLDSGAPIELETSDMILIQTALDVRGLKTSILTLLIELDF